jgi:hypothetical protein
MAASVYLDELIDVGGFRSDGGPPRASMLAPGVDDGVLAEVDTNAETLAAGAAMAASSSPVPQAMSARRSPRCVVSAVIDVLRLDPRLGPRA